MNWIGVTWPASRSIARPIAEPGRAGGVSKLKITAAAKAYFARDFKSPPEQTEGDDPSAEEERDATKP
jgi:hypothetical protein